MEKRRFRSPSSSALRPSPGHGPPQLEHAGAPGWRCSGRSRGCYKSPGEKVEDERAEERKGATRGYERGRRAARGSGALNRHLDRGDLRFDRSTSLSESE
jgi:hypothetical protein